MKFPFHFMQKQQKTKSKTGSWGYESWSTRGGRRASQNSNKGASTSRKVDLWFGNELANYGAGIERSHNSKYFSNQISYVQVGLSFLVRRLRNGLNQVLVGHLDRMESEGFRLIYLQKWRNSVLTAPHLLQEYVLGTEKFRVIQECARATGSGDSVIIIFKFHN